MCAAALFSLAIMRLTALMPLRSEGWLVLEARTGKEAIVHLDAAIRVDIVFTDIQLAGPLSGWDVADACIGSFLMMLCAHCVSYVSAKAPKMVGCLGVR